VVKVWRHASSGGAYILPWNIGSAHDAAEKVIRGE
jgi:hypothetical protein